MSSTKAQKDLLSVAGMRADYTTALYAELPEHPSQEVLDQAQEPSTNGRMASWMTSPMGSIRQKESGKSWSPHSRTGSEGD
jgi:hypothetical protein